MNRGGLTGVCSVNNCRIISSLSACNEDETDSNDPNSNKSDLLTKGQTLFGISCRCCYPNNAVDESMNNSEDDKEE